MDFYKLLGLNRAASVDEVERAYRRLARRYHPGINPGDRVAEDMYRQIQEAYDVLTDAERRSAYDSGGARPVPAQIEATVSFEGFDFSAPAEGRLAATFSELFADVFQDAAREAITPSRGADLAVTAAVPFLDAALGGTVALSITRLDRCPACLGDGRVARAPIVCPACAGQGTRRWARGHMVFTGACESCGGEGHLTSQPCRMCGAAGIAPRHTVVTVAIPSGIDSGARIAMPGHGHAGARGGPSGDLYVTVEVTPHRFFARHGRDLHLIVPVAVHEAALGARVDVPTLDGRLKVRIPPGTSSGARVRVPDKGVPGNPAGDLVVEVQIVLPPVKDERSKELLREFGRLNDADVRRHLFE